MDTSRDGNQPAGTGPTATGTRSAAAGRLRSLSMILIFDVAGPLVAYNLLRSAGLSTVSALLLSGVFPATGLAIRAIGHRRLDVVGALVLAGILVGTVLGLVTHSARLVLVEGSVPTAIFGLGCLGSLWASRPLMYSLALEFVGPDTPKGRDMILFWQHEGFRHSFRVITAVWGVGFLLEAALRVVIVYNTSPGTALAISKVMPFAWVGVLLAWMFGYTAWQKKKTERMAASTVDEVTATVDEVVETDARRAAAIDEA